MQSCFDRQNWVTHQTQLTMVEPSLWLVILTNTAAMCTQLKRLIYSKHNCHCAQMQTVFQTLNFPLELKANSTFPSVRGTSIHLFRRAPGAQVLSNAAIAEVTCA